MPSLFLSFRGPSRSHETYDQVVGMIPAEMSESSAKASWKRSRWLLSHSGHWSTIWFVLEFGWDGLEWNEMGEGKLDLPLP